MKKPMFVPSSTYRVQLHAGFTFRDLEDILDYLHELGIGAVYASPITQAVPGSQHGYDVAAAESLNPEIGTEEEMERISVRLKEYGMNWLQDIVPNHMAFDSSNPWIYDVLERGKGSEFYSFFDIDSNLSKEFPGDRIMAPFLGDTMEECLQKNELTLEFSDKGFVIRYYDKDFPVAISAYQWIAGNWEDCSPALSEAIGRLELAAAGRRRPELVLAEGEKESADPGSNWVAVKQGWMEEIRSRSGLMNCIQELLKFFNGDPPLIKELLRRQHYMLVHAQLAARRINYRRFFTVNSLICLRMEDEKVFDAYHRVIAGWFAKGYIQGLRIDHIDGLAEPGGYIRRLRRLFGKDCYMVAEKILAADESMPPEWELEGSTGYDFLALTGQLFTDPEGFAALKEFYHKEIAPGSLSYDELVYNQKLHFLKTQMGGELTNLVELSFRLNLTGERKPDKEKLKEALAIFIASFPVYRLYPEISPLPASGQLIIDTSFQKAIQRGAAYTDEFREIALFLKDFRFFTRLMQRSGPLAAKGIEDTTFYIYNALISRNEVGDSPSREGMSPAVFHRKMSERRQWQPYSMNAGSTHDTKRGEDSRVRLNCLSTMTDEWIVAVAKWRAENAGFLSRENEQVMPSANDEYFIYQSLLGALPEDMIITDEFRKRCHAFLTKALRESSVHTHYDTPDEGYENKCHGFVDSILEPGSVFLENFLPFAAKLIQLAMNFSLSELLLRLTAPGVPDLYQGAECWDLSLVDPDNRRPVDYEMRKELLRAIKEAEKKGWKAVLAFLHAHREKGAPKLFMIYKSLAYRKSVPDLFADGEYIPLDLPGRLLGYLRRDKEDWALIVVPLIRKEAFAAEIFCKLPEGAPANWVHAFSGKVFGTTRDGLEIGSVLAEFPAALLTGRSD